MNIAIIPARAGSKRLPGKNIKIFNGKPLIDWTILAALESGEFDKIIVSTDSEDILKRAHGYGLTDQYLRPDNLAKDKTTSIDVLLYEAARVQSEYCTSITTVTCLQPTSPLRTKEDINNAFEIFRSQSRDSIVSVSKPWNPPEFVMRLTSAGTISLGQINDLKRSQDLAEGFALNGAIYLSNYEALLDKRGFYTGNTGVYIMPRQRSFDIDEEVDFEIAELVSKYMFA